MEITFDKEADAVYIEFSNGDFASNKKIDEDTIIDLDKDGNIIGIEILSVSTDTVFVHKAWKDSSETIRKIRFPMVADPAGKICRAYSTYIYEEGLSLRGTFIIDPDGILKSFEINDNSIGRSSKELIRKINAVKFVREHGGNVCPANWEPGEKTLKPGLDLVGKI